MDDCAKAKNGTVLWGLGWIVWSDGMSLAWLVWCVMCSSPLTDSSAVVLVVYVHATFANLPWMGSRLCKFFYGRCTPHVWITNGTKRRLTDMLSTPGRKGEREKCPVPVLVHSVRFPLHEFWKMGRISTQSKNSNSNYYIYDTPTAGNSTLKTLHCSSQQHHHTGTSNNLATGGYYNVNHTTLFILA